MSSNKKFTIKNGKNGQFAQKIEDTDGVAVQTEASHEWVIKRVKGQTDAYQCVCFDTVIPCLYAVAYL